MGRNLVLIADGQELSVGQSCASANTAQPYVPVCVFGRATVPSVSSFQSRAATRVVSALGVRKRLQRLADTYGDSEFEDLLTKTRRQDKRRPPSRMRRAFEHSVIDIDDHELHLFVRVPDTGRPAILYLHGGGYLFGPFGPEWKLANTIAEATGSDLGVFLYPRAPEHTAPRTVAAASQALGYLDERFTGGVTLMGASAGGGLAVAVANEVGPDGSRPNSIVLISPAMDMTLSESTTALAASDVLLSADFVRLAGELYAGTLGLEHPMVSPMNGDLGGLPPIQVYAGEYEILLPSIRTFADQALAMGVNVGLVIGEGQQHTYPTAPVPEGREARAGIAEFIRAHSGDEHEPR